MPAISIDLRRRAVDAYLAGEGTYLEVSTQFRVGEASLNRWLRLHRENGVLNPKPHRSGRKARVDGDGMAELRRLVVEQPDATLAELSKRYAASRGVVLALSIICRALQKLDLNRKKRSSTRRSNSEKMYS